MMNSTASDKKASTQTTYAAVCDECAFTRVRSDVIEADDLGGAHTFETGHATRVEER